MPKTVVNNRTRQIEMKTLKYGWLSCLTMASLLGTLAAAEGAKVVVAKPDAKSVEFFEKHIRPVLTEQCYKCHSQDAKKVKGGLLLDTREGVLHGGDTGPAAVPGKVAESLIISALKHEEHLEMPPGKKLPSDVIAKFEQWIEMGAPDTRGGKTALVRKGNINIEEGRKFWAFQPPRKMAPPKTRDVRWPRSDIDRFVLAGLEEHKLTPVADAAPRELVRRLYFDLIGLPPTPAEIEQWTSRLTSDEGIDQAGLAALVDKLLASQRFGERWGRFWLDIARYADSNGNIYDFPFPEAWRYRNWVIDAMNADMPYDKFITAQLAGDLLPYDSPKVRNEQLIATGFLAIGSKPREKRNPNFQLDVVAEQIEVTTTAMLGLTVACARCHDHKFDPIPTSEYYAMAGIFSSSRVFHESGSKGNSKDKVSGDGLIQLLANDLDGNASSKQQLLQHEKLSLRRDYLVAALVKLGRYEAPDKNAEGKNPVERPESQRLRKLKFRLEKAKAQGDANDIQRAQEEITRYLGMSPARDGKSKGSEKSDMAQVKSLRDELAGIDAELAALQAKSAGNGQAMGVMEGKPADLAIRVRGDTNVLGPVVPRGFVSVAMIGEVPEIVRAQSGRLQLAQWMTSRNHPLTARVMANRIWQHLLGRGIVKTVDNFGKLGERPTHPELLDYLAVQFMEGGWSVKKLIRTIALTRTYQLGSMHDEQNYALEPDNTWLWRANPRRLDAESFRDAILAISGNLDLERPAGAVQLPKNKRQAAPKVRTIYLPILRDGELESLTLFDFPNSSIPIGQRAETTVPTQSLYLLNSTFVMEQARATAVRLLSSKMGDADRIDQAYLAAFGRRPTNDQRARAVAYLASENTSASRRLAAWSRFCQALIAAAEFRYLD